MQETIDQDELIQNNIDLVEYFKIPKIIYCRVKDKMNQCDFIDSPDRNVIESFKRRKIKSGCVVVSETEIPIDLYHPDNFLSLLIIVMRIAIKHNFQLTFTTDKPREELVEAILFQKDKFVDVIEELREEVLKAQWVY
jgi:ferritin-like protein